MDDRQGHERSVVLPEDRVRELNSSDKRGRFINMHTDNTTYEDDMDVKPQLGPIVIEPFQFQDQTTEGMTKHPSVFQTLISNTKSKPSQSNEVQSCQKHDVPVLPKRSDQPKLCLNGPKKGGVSKRGANTSAPLQSKQDSSAIIRALMGQGNSSDSKKSGDKQLHRMSAYIQGSGGERKKIFIIKPVNESLFATKLLGVKGSIKVLSTGGSVPQLKAGVTPRILQLKDIISTSEEGSSDIKGQIASSTGKEKEVNMIPSRKVYESRDWRVWKKRTCDDCTQCIRGFKTGNQLKMHLFHFHTQPECKACMKKFALTKSLKRHIRVLHSVKPTSPYLNYSSNCSKIRNIEGIDPWTGCKLEDSIETTFLSPQYICTYCGAHFATVIATLYHYQIHTGFKPFNCLKCGIAFTSETKLGEHKHYRSESNTCFQCQRTFQTPLLRRIHACQDFMVSYGASLESGQGEFFCQLCYGTFPSVDALEEHQTLHTGVQKFTCTICGHGLHRFEDVVEHVNDHMNADAEHRHSTLENGGDAIKEEFNYLIEELDEKMISIEQETTLQESQSPAYICQECDTSFDKARDLLVHYQIHTGITPYNCVRCGDSFADRNYLADHRRQHVQEEPEVCSQCDVEFDTWLMLHTHSCPGKKETDKKRKNSDGLCPFCGFRLSDAGARNDEHLSKHTGIRKFTCTICGSEFFEFLHLWRHIDVHMREQEKLRCNNGAVAFNSMPVVETQDKMTTNTYQCMYCTEVFQELLDYEEHVESHIKISSSQETLKDKCRMLMQDNKYRCGYCTELFRLRVNYIYHVRHRHTGIRPHVCRKCFAAFIKHSQLSKHRCVKEIQLFCKVCEKNFSGRDIYEQHIETHLKLTPEQREIRDQCRVGGKGDSLECGCCGVKSTNPVAFTNHIRNHTGVLPYKCGKCKESFMSEGILKKHKCTKKSKQKHDD